MEADKKPTSNRLISPLLMDSISNTDLRPAPKTIGIDSKKENLAAVSRFNPRHIPAIIVMPEREVPGIKAMA